MDAKQQCFNKVSGHHSKMLVVDAMNLAAELSIRCRRPNSAKDVCQTERMATARLTGRHDPISAVLGQTKEINSSGFRPG